MGEKIGVACTDLGLWTTAMPTEPGSQLRPTAICTIQSDSLPTAALRESEWHSPSFPRPRSTHSFPLELTCLTFWTSQSAFLAFFCLILRKEKESRPDIPISSAFSFQQIHRWQLDPRCKAQSWFWLVSLAEGGGGKDSSVTRVKLSHMGSVDITFRGILRLLLACLAQLIAKPTRTLVQSTMWCHPN